MEIRPVGAKSFHVDVRTDGQMDRHNEGNSRYSQFCERAYEFRAKRQSNAVTHSRLQPPTTP
jgi:hypothetical protein